MVVIFCSQLHLDQLQWQSKLLQQLQLHLIFIEQMDILCIIQLKILGNGTLETQCYKILFYQVL
ncbi:MAG: hypothetical protein EB133_13100 [Betaproteobacteria bacterium]|nr:hypothetical protein [Betaproteobacteria bacterium]